MTALDIRTEREERLTHCALTISESESVHGAVYGYAALRLVRGQHRHRERSVSEVSGLRSKGSRR